MKTIKNCLEFGIKKLKKVAERPRLEVEMILIHILAINRMQFFLNQDGLISSENQELFKNLLFRRSKNEPLEYILGKVSFYSEEFFIKNGALIPRPETELLIDEVASFIESLLEKNQQKKISILEIGVGSGIISVMLAKLFSQYNIEITAVDISEKALEIAKTNIEKFEVQDKINLLQSDLFENIPKELNFDILVSNPTYIADDEAKNLQKELSFEPNQALYGGNIGDEILKKIIDISFKRKIKNIFCEMGFDQKERISKFLSENSYKNYKLEFYKDLANLDRGFNLKFLN